MKLEKSSRTISYIKQTLTKIKIPIVVFLMLFKLFFSWVNIKLITFLLMFAPLIIKKIYIKQNNKLVIKL